MAASLNTRSGTLATAVCLALALVVGSAQTPKVPASVSQKANQVRRGIEARLRIADIVASEDARPSITRIVRGYQRAAKAWQIDPVVLRELNDQQVADYLIARAQQVLSCTAFVWSRVLLEKGLDAEPDLINQVRSELTTPGMAGGYSVGPDCISLLNQAGEPIVVRRVTDLTQALAFARAVDQSAARRLQKSGPMENPTYRANVAYFAREFAPALTEDRGFAQALQRADVGSDRETSIYRFSMINLSLYISVDRQGRTRFIFMAPFSS